VPIGFIYAVLIITLALIAVVVVAPRITITRSGKILAFLALFIFPILAGSLGYEHHMERSKQTTFCLSCHVMEPYGRSLSVDDPTWIPAAHYQNHRVPHEEACYTCHTDYVMYGTIKSKLRGLHHVYVQYLGNPKPPLHLYHPYNNRECLHCHLGARSFEEGATHNADPEIMKGIKSNEMSCLTSGCHDQIHNTTKLDNVKYWNGK
jgi:cytochrome c-type protein NapC